MRERGKRRRGAEEREREEIDLTGENLRKEERRRCNRVLQL